MKRYTRFFVLLMAAVMLLSLTACGKGGSKPAATPTPESVYTSEFTTFSGSYSGSEARFNVRLVDEDGFVGTINELVGQREPYEGEVAEWDGQFDVYETRMYRMDFSGKMTKLDYEPVKVSAEREDAEVGCWLSGMLKTDSGFLAVEEVYVSWNDAPEDVQPFSDDWYMYSQSEERYYLRHLDENGREIGSAQMDLTAIPDEGGYFSPYRIAMLDDKTVLTSGENTLYAFDVETGRYLYRIDTDLEWIMNLLQTADGEIYVAGYGGGANGYSTVLRPLDAQTRKLGESLPVEGDMYSAISGGGKYLIYYTNGNYFYGYDQETQEEVKLFNWINVDLLSDDLNSYAVLADGTVVGLLTEWDKNYEKATQTLVKVREVPYASLPEKTVLTLATDGLDWNLRRELVRFNRNSDTVRIELLDYSEYDDYENDFDENGVGEFGGMTKLRTEILAGNMPDILDLNGMPTRQLAAKGLLLDLYPLLDADPALSRDDIFPNVLKALETNGKLTSVCSGFYIQTCIGAASVVGDTPGWTYQELNDALATMPEGCSVFGISTTRNSVLETMLSLDMGDFVDWETGKVSFESQEFIDLLNFAAQFPASFDWNHEWTEEDEDYNRIRQGQQLLLNYGLSSLDELIAYETMFGGPDSFTFIGYPTSEGVGNLLVLNSGYAVSRDCKDPEAAWQFLRTLLTEEYEEERGYNFPANVNLFEKRKQDALTPSYLKDENGRIVLDPETGEKQMEVKSWSVDFDTWEDIPIYVYTPEQVAKIEQLIADTDRVPDQNQAVVEIVREQAQAFFAGQRTAEEVAKLVQSKANIYVNEQR